MAAPMANGVATKAESKVTTNDPKIIGRALNLAFRWRPIATKEKLDQANFINKESPSPFEQRKVKSYYDKNNQS